jgi:nicotinamide-nucleotide amidase
LQEIKEIGQDINQLVIQLADHLMSQKKRLITAESCTGGMIGASCTQLAGSSAWFFGGLISYDNLAKERMLKVTPSNLQEFGAVSAEVVEQMCAGALNYGADISVAVSGVAGPGGGSEEKPVGTVYIGWLTKVQASQGQAAKVQRFQFPGDRDAVRELTLVNALQGILDLK